MTNITTIAICMVIYGANHIISIHEYGRKKRKWLSHLLDLKRRSEEPGMRYRKRLAAFAHCSPTNSSRKTERRAKVQPTLE